MKNERINLKKRILSENKDINKVKQGSIELKKFDKVFKEFTENRGRPLFYNNFMSGRGNGPYLEFIDNSVKLDFITGIGVNFLGYNNPSIIEKQIEGISNSHIYESHLINSNALNKFMKNTIGLVKKDTNLAHCFPAMTGAMANENALKVAFHSHKDKPRDEIIVFDHAFHGRTHLLAQLTDNPDYRVGLPTPFKVNKIPFYSADKPNETINKLKALLKSKKDKIAVFGCELIQGEGGYIGAPSEWFKEIFELLKKYKVRIWVDEIQTGGRMINVFRYRDLKLGKYIDILTLGKMTLVCSTLFTKEMNPAAGLLSQTFAGSTSTLGAACAVSDFIQNSKTFYGKKGKLESLTKYLNDEISLLIKKYPNEISNLRNFGGMFAFQYKKGDKIETLNFLKDLFSHGLIAFICGHGPYLVRFLPPFPVLTQKHIKEAIKILDKCINNKIN